MKAKRRKGLIIPLAVAILVFAGYQHYKRTHIAGRDAVEGFFIHALCETDAYQQYHANKRPDVHRRIYDGLRGAMSSYAINDQHIVHIASRPRKTIGKLVGAIASRSMATCGQKAHTRDEIADFITGMLVISSMQYARPATPDSVPKRTAKKPRQTS